jgi:hypothetical protein
LEGETWLVVRYGPEGARRMLQRFTHAREHTERGAI